MYMYTILILRNFHIIVGHLQIMLRKVKQCSNGELVVTVLVSLLEPQF